MIDETLLMEQSANLPCTVKCNQAEINHILWNRVDCDTFVGNIFQSEIALKVNLLKYHQRMHYRILKIGIRGIIPYFVQDSRARICLK